MGGPKNINLDRFYCMPKNLPGHCFGFAHFNSACMSYGESTLHSTVIYLGDTTVPLYTTAISHVEILKSALAHSTYRPLWNAKMWGIIYTASVRQGIFKPFRTMLPNIYPVDFQYFHQVKKKKKKKRKKTYGNSISVICNFLSALSCCYTCNTYNVESFYIIDWYLFLV